MAVTYQQVLILTVVPKKPHSLYAKMHTPYLQLYEKRTKVVKEKESHIWRDILPSMMSEEEEKKNEYGEVYKFKRRRQAWKSTKLCHFIDKLDQRLEKNKSKTNNPARDRCYLMYLHLQSPG